MIAAFGKANGLDLAAEGNHALERLALRAQQALDDPASFEHLAGTSQVALDATSKSNWAWLEPYCWTVACEPALLARRASLRPLGTTRLGGDLSSVFPEANAP
jgi:poly(beta-D-mannuronate) lyase